MLNISTNKYDLTLTLYQFDLSQLIVLIQDSGFCQHEVLLFKHFVFIVNDQKVLAEDDKAVVVFRMRPKNFNEIYF